jgi:hypothetical protein
MPSWSRMNCPITSVGSSWPDNQGVEKSTVGPNLAPSSAPLLALGAVCRRLGASFSREVEVRHRWNEFGKSNYVDNMCQAPCKFNRQGYPFFHIRRR